MSVAHTLCSSLAVHWRSGTTSEWVPPFEGARLARVSEFTAQTPESAMDHALGQHSALYTLLANYEIAQQAKLNSIVARVRQEVKRSQRTQHLVPRFNRSLDVSKTAPPLKVDFLGQHYACYFVQVTESERGIEASTERAYGKLFELQALRRFVKVKPKFIGLLEDERPEAFELLLVGDQSHPVRRRALAQIEALADRGQVIARPINDVVAAAEHVVRQERRAA